MRILALPNSFKGSLTALETVRALQSGLDKRHTLWAFPVSDGGDGFIDFFAALDPKARLIPVRAKNAFLKTRKTAYLLLSDRKTAVVETARVCGLGRTKKEELDPLGASSYGVGQVILQAVKNGAKTVYVGLGGVACNDGGAGTAKACGARFLDKDGQELPDGAEPLLKLKSLDLSGLKKNLRGIKIYAVADVTNPLLGPKSSAKVFGPQKGATPAQVKILDKAMAVYARVIKKQTGKDAAHTPSTAAAGAIAAGLYGLFNAKLLLGAEFLFKKAGFEKYAKQADLIITSEGKLDAQTFYGKAPLAVLKLAKKYIKPVLFICGKLDEKALRGQQYAPDQIAVLSDFAQNETDSVKHAAKHVKIIAQNL